ncbi:MAG: hypothetical protein HC799_04915 [Limnothrix sp. RL_2_0]|nr:hypothetical protein [Limnothrix sp. RL_2_0]
MNIAPSVQVNILSRSGQTDSAIISKAEQKDMPRNWQCEWGQLFQNTDELYYESLVKIECQGSLLGLMKYALYPDAPEQVEFLEINNLEALPQAQRQVDPVGRWLIWYACNIAINYCPQEPSSQILFLNSVEQAFAFYEDKIRMEYIEPVTLAPGEDGYAFRFNRRKAEQFCKQQEVTYGCPVVL